MKILIIILGILLLLISILSTFHNTDDIVVTVHSEKYYSYFEYAAIEYNNQSRTDQDIVVEMDTLENTISEITNESVNQTDMFFIPSYLMPLLVEEKIISPIKYDEQLFSEDTNNISHYNGSTYILPYEFANPVFIYDPSYYKSAPELITDLEPQDWATNFFSMTVAEIFIYQMWGYIHAFDTTSDTNTPEVVAYFTEIQSYYANDVGIWGELTDPFTANQQIVDAYLNNEIQAMIVPSTYVSQLSHSSGDTYKVALMPTVNEFNDAHTYSATYGLVMNASTENQKRCQDFINYLSTPEMLQNFIEYTGSASPFLYQDTSGYKAYTAAIDIENIYNSIPHYQETWYYQDMVEFAKIMNQILIEQKDVNQSLEEFDKIHKELEEEEIWETKVHNN